MVQVQAQTAVRSSVGQADRMDVQFVAGESYEVAVRGHRVLVDQPANAGGQDLAPTPTELFVVSLATCVAFYAGRYLTRHGFSRDGLGVSVEYEMASDRPARVATVRLTLRVPADLPPQRWAALQAVVSRCTVHNTLTRPPVVTIELT
jgi:putative redox protein